MHLPKMADYEAARREARFVLPEHYNFGVDLIDERARRSDKTACVAVDAAGNRVRELRFSDLSRSSSRFANVLRETGVERGDFAFVMIGRIPAWYDVLIGCAKAGVVAMPATTLLTSKDIEYRVNAAGARVAIVTDDHASKVDAIRAACPTLERCILVPHPSSAGAGSIERRGWTNAAAAMDAAQSTYAADRRTRSDEPMLIYFTSGTTSMPKMVARDHGYALANVLTGRYWMDLGEDDVHWTLSDTGWAKAAWGVLFAPWQRGAAIVLHDAAGFDADLHLKLIDRLGVTTFCAPPTVYRMFAQMDLGEYAFGSLRHSLGAGEPLNPEAIKVWEEATGTLIHDGYGQTESINLVANYPALPVRPGSMGKPVPTLDVDIVDDDGTLTEPGGTGHIAIRQPDPVTMLAYWRRPEADAEKIVNGWLLTGDVGHKDEDGYLWFTGRADDVITSGGVQFGPGAVEECLRRHPGVALAAVIGVPEPAAGEAVKAFVVAVDPATAGSGLEEALLQHARRALPPHAAPRSVELVDDLPRTTTGKIMRRELRRRELDRQRRGGAE